jgi:hypothetical protein
MGEQLLHLLETLNCINQQNEKNAIGGPSLENCE